MCRFIAYYRVSTQRQGQSGLGLDAQRRAVSSFLSTRQASELLAEYEDIESGAHNDRPYLQKAIAHCLATGAVLLIAKLDRLSRDAAFLLRLQQSKVKFLACDMPEADNFMVGIMALLAEKERLMISERTKAALAAAKERGVRLGGYRENAFRGCTHHEGGAARRQQANEFISGVSSYLRDAQAEGLSLRGIAAKLNGMGILTSKNGTWSAEGVRLALKRCDEIGL